MPWSDHLPSAIRSEFRAAARKRYGVFDRTSEDVKVEKREEVKTETKRRRIVGRRTEC